MRHILTVTTAIICLVCSMAQAGTFQQANDAWDGADESYDAMWVVYDQVWQDPPNPGRCNVAHALIQIYLMEMPAGVLQSVLAKQVGMDTALNNGNEHHDTGDARYGAGVLHHGAAVNLAQFNVPADPVLTANIAEILDLSIDGFNDANAEYCEARTDYSHAGDLADQIIEEINDWLANR